MGLNPWNATHAWNLSTAHPAAVTPAATPPPLWHAPRTTHAAGKNMHRKLMALLEPTPEEQQHEYEAQYGEQFGQVLSGVLLDRPLRIRGAGADLLDSSWTLSKAGCGEYAIRNAKGKYLHPAGGDDDATVKAASHKHPWRFLRVGTQHNCGKYLIWVKKRYLTAHQDGTVTLEPRDVCSKRQRWCVFVDKANADPEPTPRPTPEPTPEPEVMVSSDKLPAAVASRALQVIGLAPAQVDSVLQLISLPENGTPRWWKNYGYIEALGDGRGYTATLFGACSGTGDLAMIFEELKSINPKHPLVDYLPTLKRKRGEDIDGLKPIVKLIQGANDDPQWREAVWRVYLDLYWKFAAEFAEKKGSCAMREGPVLALAISRGFMVDTAINHGANLESFKPILKKMTKQPANEQDWLAEFISAREHLLKSGFQDLDTSGTGDRCKLWRRLLADNNLALSRPIIAYPGYWGRFTLV